MGELALRLGKDAKSRRERYHATIQATRIRQSSEGKQKWQRQERAYQTSRQHAMKRLGL